MELREERHGYTRWVAPFPDEESDVRVEMKKLSQGEVTAILDRHSAGHTGASLARRQKANREIVRRSVVGWEGFTDHGEPLLCDEKTKERLLDKQVINPDADGRPNQPKRIPLWVILQDRFEEAEEEEEKNS